MADDKTWLIALAGGVALLLFIRPSSTGGASSGSAGASPGTGVPTGGGGASGGGSLIAPTGPAITTIPVPGLAPAPSISATPLPTAQQLIAPPIAIALIGAGGLTSPTSPLGPIQQITEGGLSIVKTGAPIFLTPPSAGVTGSPLPTGGASTASPDILTGSPNPSFSAVDPTGTADYIATDPNAGNAVAAIANGDIEVSPTSMTVSDMADLSTFMTTLGVVALVADIGFTIAGNAPDAVKAIDTALDVVAIAALYIPVYGWIVSIVVEVVKFVFGLFAGSLFGGLSHAQRQALETARYASAIHPMYAQIATSYSPRELLSVLIAWGSGSCGGTNPAAVVTGLHNTPSPGVDLYFGNEGCYYHAGPNAGITFDEQAEWLATKGQTADFFASAQSGISTSLLATFNATIFNLVTARCQVYSEEAAQGMTLDQMDTVASEYRRTDTLNRVANIYGFGKWQDFFAWLVGPYWSAYVAANTSGSVNGLANSLGYTDAIALRDAAFSGFLPTAQRIMAIEDRIAVYETLWGMRTPMTMLPATTPDAAVQNYLEQLAQRQAAIAAIVPVNYLQAVGFPVS